VIRRRVLYAENNSGHGLVLSRPAFAMIMDVAGLAASAPKRIPGWSERFPASAVTMCERTFYSHDIH